MCEATLWPSWAADRSSSALLRPDRRPTTDVLDDPGSDAVRQGLLDTSVFIAAESGRVLDVWIAVVASAHDLAVVTQDDDSEVLAELGLLEVLKV